MRILISSHRYAPDVGGIETVSAVMVQHWRAAGHTVQIVTATPLPPGVAEMETDIWRQPSRGKLLELVGACDIFWHSNISLQTAWPLLFQPRPWFVTTHTWLHGLDGQMGWRGRLKRAVMRLGTNLYPSTAVAEHVGLPGALVLNPYDAKIFRLMPDVARERDLIFVGRLVSDKGVDLLLQALQALRDRRRPGLTIVGGGPEEAALRAQCEALDLTEQVRFAGYLRGTELAQELNRHRVLVVPSRWEEPFGLVALEGMACGCLVVASQTGGLGEAVGPGGAMVPNGNIERMAQEIDRALTPGPGRSDPRAVREHLVRFEAPRVAARYLELFEAGRSERVV
jgi:glycogen synthase